jgi:hypothetical protein
MPQPFQDFLFHRNSRASRSQEITITGPWTSAMLPMGVFVVSGAAAGHESHGFIRSWMRRS